MTGTGRPILKLAWFEGMVVSLGASIGIVWASKSPVVPQRLSSLALPASATYFAWLLAFVLVGWLGWHIHMKRPKSMAFLVWILLVACMLIWRPLFCGANTIWLGTMTGISASLLATLLLPLVAAIDIAAGWICLPLLIWLGYRAVLIYLIVAFI